MGKQTINGDTALFDEAREHVLSLVSRLTPDAGYNAWQGAIHEGLSRFLYKKTKRRPRQ